MTPPSLRLPDLGSRATSGPLHWPSPLPASVPRGPTVSSGPRGLLATHDAASQPLPARPRQPPLRAHACSRPSPRRPPPRGVRGQGPSYSLMSYLDPETAPSTQQVTVVSAGGTDGLRRFLHHPCSGPTVTSSAVLSWSPGWKRPCSTRALTGPADGHATLILPFSVEANFNLFLRILKAILIA